MKARADRRSAEVLHLEHLADLDDRRPWHRVGTTFDTLDRLIEVLDPPDPVARGEFTDVRKWPFGHRAVFAGKGDARPLAAFLNPARVDEQPGVDQRLVERAHVRQKFAGRHAARLGVFGRLDYHHDAHCALSGRLELVGALVRASLGRAGIDNELAGDVVARAEHGNLRGLSLALARSRCRDGRKAASGCRKEKAPGDDPRAYANFNARASARGSELRGLLLSFGYR
jgi:hypothetical protein